MTTLNLSGRALWIDFRGAPKSWDHFYATAYKAGVRGALRYGDAGSEGKQIHAAERQAAARQGIEILLVDELGTGDAWDAADDRSAGVARGRSALADARAEGFGPVGIAAAADAHASGKQITDAVQYATGFASVVTKKWAGFYGFREVLTAVRAAGVVSWYWLCGSMPSAEDARWIAFWQDNRGTFVVDGVQCDKNWRLDGPLPGAATNIEEDDVSALDVWGYKNKAAAPKGDAYWYLRNTYDTATATRAAVIALAAAKQGVDPSALEAMIDKAVAEHTPTAAEIAAESKPAIAEAVHAALGEDNADQADAIVDAIVGRLQNGATA